ncbi:mitochondrial glutathione transporter SLC25A40 isoform 2-T3 [Syngnathus typhle]
MVSSCSGALLTSLLVTPLDVVKIRLQAQKSPLPKGKQPNSSFFVTRQSNVFFFQCSGKCFVYCNGLMDHVCVCMNGWYKAPGHFNGTADAFVKIVRNEGIRSLWSGLPPTLVMAVPATVIYFTCYDQLRAILKVKMGQYEQFAPMLSGAVARVGAVSVISPIELLRTKKQSEKLTYGQLRNCVQTAVKAEGWLSLWRGLGPSLLRDVPFSAIYWYNYERGKRWLCQHYGTSEPTFAMTFMSGATSGTIASILTLPFDVVKTRRQVELGELQAMNLSHKASSTVTVMKKIVMQHGVKGLFAGFLPRVVKVAPACAIMISSYEMGKDFFRKYNQARVLGPLHTSNT